MSKKIVEWEETSKDLLDEIDIDLQPKEMPFEQVIESLLDENTPFPARYLYRLSDLSDDDLQRLRQHWHNIALWRRRALMEDLQMMVEKDTILSFESLARLALTDEDAKVRFGAIETLIANECESSDLVDIYLSLMEKDPDQNVRRIAIGALGHFVYLAEMDTFQAEIKSDLENRLLAIAQTNSNMDIRRFAIEALGYSTRDEIPALIETAYNSLDPQQQTSALIAMGRSGIERWQPQVVGMLTHSNPSLRAESARATGELGISEARASLVDLIDDANQEVCLAAIWSLSQIGGKGVRKILQSRLSEAEDSEEIEFLESALDNLDFNEGIHDMSLLGVDEEDLFSGDDSDEFDPEDFFSYDEDEEDYEGEVEEGELDEFVDEDDEDDLDFTDDDDDDDDGDLWR
ncbi:MAG: HEAT repeat domain-containing protein [Chloroflexota bacterium]